MPQIKARIKSLRTILSAEQTEILNTALLSMIPAILTKATGLFYNLLTASFYGTKDLRYNNFLLASTIPDLISNVLISGLLGSIIIPTLIACLRKEGKDSFEKLYNSLLTTILMTFTIVAAITLVFADPILRFGLRYLVTIDTLPSSEEMLQIITLMRLLLLPQIIIAVSAFISSLLNVYNRYLVPQLAPLFFNLGKIFGALIILPIVNFDPAGLVIGVYIGVFFHLLIQIPLFRPLGINIRLIFDSGNKYIKEVLMLSLPRTIALASEYFALTFNSFLAYAVQGIVAFNYANIISLTIPQVFAMPFAVSSFTHLAKHFDEGDENLVHETMLKTFNQMMFLALPFIVTIIVLRVPITRLAFGILPGTRLDLDGTYMIAWILMWFAVGHVFVCGKWFMYRVLYAAKETFWPLVVSVIVFLLTIFLSILFSNLFSHNKDYSVTSTVISVENLTDRVDMSLLPGNVPKPAVGGIALGMTVAYSIEFILLLTVFNYRKYRIPWRKYINSLGIKFIAATFMFVVMYLIYKIWVTISYSVPVSAGAGFTGSTTLNLVILTFITSATSFMVYYLISLLLKVEEIKILKRYLNPIFRLGGVRIN